MRSPIYQYTSKIILSLFIFLLFAVPIQAYEDAIIAIVNNEIVTLKDLKDYIRSTYISLAANGIKEEQLQSIMNDLQENGLNKLIEDKLMLSKANDLEFEINQKAIDEKIDELKEKYPSEEAFMNSLIQNGATITDLRNKLENQLKINYVIEREVKSKVFVNPQEVTEYYEKNMDDFHRSERIFLESIYISSIDNKIEAKKSAENALELLKQGQDFFEVHDKFSDAPSIGVIEKGQLMPEIEDAVFSLSKGELSEIVEVESGYYIFLLIGRSPAQIATLKEVKDTIANMLYQKKFRDKFNSWINELKNEAYIEIKN